MACSNIVLIHLKYMYHYIQGMLQIYLWNFPPSLHGSYGTLFPSLPRYCSFCLEFFSMQFLCVLNIYLHLHPPLTQTSDNLVYIKCSSNIFQVQISIEKVVPK